MKKKVYDDWYDSSLLLSSKIRHLIKESNLTVDASMVALITNIAEVVFMGYEADDRNEILQRLYNTVNVLIKHFDED